MAVYTPLDYAVSLAILIAVMWLASRYLFRFVELDIYFFYAMIPVMFFAISIRVLVDAGIFTRSKFWSVTPGIYLVGAIFGLLVIGAGKTIEDIKHIPYWKGAIITGIPFAAYFAYLLILQMRSPILSLQPVILALVIAYVIYVLSNLLPATRFFRERENIAIIYSHLLDGSATYIGIDKYGFSEEHILPEIFIEFAGTALIMIPLKIIVVLGALYFLEKWRVEEQDEGSDLYYKMVKFVFFIFGFGPGTRDALLIAL